MAEQHVEESKETSSDFPTDKQHSDVITVVLTSDNHLGDTAFSQNPRKLEERQQRLRRAFQQATDFAVGQSVDLFIQAGDLFNTPDPDERDRSFVAARLAQLKQANIQTLALGGVYDTPASPLSSRGEALLAPQMSYARLGALHYFPPQPALSSASEEQASPASVFQSSSPIELDPLFLTIRGLRLGICGLGVISGQEGDPLEMARMLDSLDQAAISVLLLHAPIEGFTTGSSLLDTRAQVSRRSISELKHVKYLLAGYHHAYRRARIGQVEVIVAGPTQHINFSDPDDQPGFVFLGLAADGVRWCNQITVDASPVRRLQISTSDLWPEQSESALDVSPTERILERLRPLCAPDVMVQLRLQGQLSRGQFHELDLNQIRSYGEQNCFALAIDDSTLSLLSEGVDAEESSQSSGLEERFSVRDELIKVAEEWISASDKASEQQALRVTRDELLAVLEEVKGSR